MKAFHRLILFCEEYEFPWVEHAYRSLRPVMPSMGKERQCMLRVCESASTTGPYAISLV